MFNLGNLNEVMRSAGKLRETLEKAVASLGQVRAEGVAGGGAVKATANGRLELVSLRIEPKLLADNDVELLEDLVVAAVNQALVKAREEAARTMQGAAGGLPLGPLSSMLGPGAAPGSAPGADDASDPNTL